MYPKVDMKVSQMDGSWRVEFCFVWRSADWAHFIQSEGNYSTRERAVIDLKQRAMQHLHEMDRTINEQKVEWHTLAA